MHMLKHLKILLLAAFAALIFGLAPVAVIAAPPAPDCTDPSTLSTADAIQCGANNAAGVPDSGTPVRDLNATIANIINILSTVVGIAAVIMIIIGGFRYITSGGSQEGVKSAKNTIMYALIGLVIVALAQIIVNFVLNKATTTCTETAPGSGRFRDSSGKSCKP